MATRTTISPTAVCVCDEAAEWSNYSKRYVCRNKAAHGYHGNRFVGGSGYCEEMMFGDNHSFNGDPCTRLASIAEPETIPHFNWTTHQIEQVPNVNHLGKLVGKRYCGLHSPSRKAEKRAQNALLEDKASDSKRKSRESFENAKLATIDDEFNQVQRLLATHNAWTVEAQRALNSLKEKAIANVIS